MPTSKRRSPRERGLKRVTIARLKRLAHIRRLIIDGWSRDEIARVCAREYGIAESVVLLNDFPDVIAGLRKEDAESPDAAACRVVYEQRLLETARALAAVARAKRAGPLAKVSALRTRMDVDTRLADLQGVAPRTDGDSGGGFVLRLDLEPESDAGGDDAP